MNDSKQPPSTPAVVIEPTRAATVLFLIVFLLLASHVIQQVLHYQWNRGHWVLRDLFDVDLEENFPTWFSAFLHLTAALLLYAIAAEKKIQRDPFARYWLVLSNGFLVLSVDEVAGIHEALNTVMDIAWTYPGGVVALVIAGIYLRFLFHLPKTTRRWFLISGVVFIVGAIGVEHAADWYLENNETDSLGYNLITAIEEGLEMIGMVLFVNATLRYIAQEQIPIAAIVRR